MPFATQIDLEGIRLSDKGQTAKDRCCIYLFYVKSKKNPNKWKIEFTDAGNRYRLVFARGERWRASNMKERSV